MHAESDHTVNLRNTQGLRYEGGFCDVKTLKNIKVKLNVNTEDYNGPHDEAPGADTDAIVITRS